jgi:hypothetical protein
MSSGNMLYCIAKDSIPEQPDIKALPKMSANFILFAGRRARPCSRRRPQR